MIFELEQAKFIAIISRLKIKHNAINFILRSNLSFPEKRIALKLELHQPINEFPNWVACDNVYHYCKKHRTMIYPSSYYKMYVMSGHNLYTKSHTIYQLIKQHMSL